MLIGITGTSGSGKSTVSKVFEKHGFTNIDADALSRDVAVPYSACLDEITAAFGKDILFSDGSLNRRALGEIVFSDEDKLDLLTAITHKYILIEMNRIIAETEGDILIDAPLLFEADIDKICQFTIGVISQRCTQIKRICARDNISPKTAKARLDRQKKNSFFIENCDFVIENNSTADELIKKTEELIYTLRKRCSND